MMLECVLLQDTEGQYALTGPLLPLAIPPTLQGSLLARLDRLGAAREVAQRGAVLGREFAYALLRAVAPQDEATLRDALSRLVAAELLYQRGLPPHSTYHFKHALVQRPPTSHCCTGPGNSITSRLPRCWRRTSQNFVATQPEVLARHYTAAGLPAQALPVWRRAGEQALARSAHREATRCLEEALEAFSSSQTVGRCRSKRLMYGWHCAQPCVRSTMDDVF